ncbi:MAG: pyruvate kinase [Candidatus Zixiibacteriota bacterium]
MKKTKILATYGPAIASQRTVAQIVTAGANCFRVNCSHGDRTTFTEAVGTIRKASKNAPYPVGVLFDISGPKLRLDRFQGQLMLSAGDSLTLSVAKSDLPKRLIGVNHPAIIKSIAKGQRVFIDDGAIALEVLSTGTSSAKLRAINSGVLLPGKGVNLPDSKIGIPTIGAKDRADIKTAVELGADFLALSFVRSPEDVKLARKLVKQYGGNQRIISKLEKRDAIEDLDLIMELSDGVMVARGDLGVEMPPEELPRLQKRIIAMANRQSKIVIVATQMLESMRFSPRATRAEINDVASAVFDLADVVMLSAETASGKYPLEAVKTMAAVIEATERGKLANETEAISRNVRFSDSMAIARLVSRASDNRDVPVIFAFTTSGFTAALISNLFPPQPIIALTPHEQVQRQCSLLRSVYAIKISQPGSFEGMLAAVNRLSKKYYLAKPGQHVIITGGAPFGSTVATNFMMFHEVKK